MSNESIESLSRRLLALARKKLNLMEVESALVETGGALRKGGVALCESEAARDVQRAARQLSEGLQDGSLLDGVIERTGKKIRGVTEPMALRIQEGYEKRSKQIRVAGLVAGGGLLVAVTLGVFLAVRSTRLRN